MYKLEYDTIFKLVFSSLRSHTKKVKAYTNFYQHKDILLPKRRERINFDQLAFIFLGSVGGSKFLTQVQQKKVAKKKFFTDIAKITAAANFYKNDYAMHIVQLNTLKMPVHKYQNTQKALQLRKNSFLCVHLFSYCKSVIFYWTENQ